MSCKQCGYVNETGARFCVRCGNDLKRQEVKVLNNKSRSGNGKIVLFSVIGTLVLVAVIVIVLFAAGIFDSGNDKQYAANIENGDSNKQSLEDVSQEEIPEPTPEKMEQPVTSVSVAAINLSETEVALVMGKTYLLNIEVMPEEATNKNIIWESSDDSIVTVNENGAITGNSIGDATITATAEDGGVMAVCAVTVESEVVLNNLNYDMTNQRNMHADMPILLEPDYIYFNQDGKLYRSNYDGSEKVQITDILDKDSEIALLNDEIYFLGTKEDIQYLYCVKSDGSQQPETIERITSEYEAYVCLGDQLGEIYADRNSIQSLIGYQDRLYFVLIQEDIDAYNTGNGKDYSGWSLSYYIPEEDMFDNEFVKSIEEYEWNYPTAVWLGNGSLYYTDTFDVGFFKKPFSQESSLLSNVTPKDILSDEENIYFIDADYNSLNRMTLEGTLPEKLQDNVSYYTMTDSGELMFVSGDKVYKTDKGFATAPEQVAEGITEFIYAGDFLYYFKPDQSLWRVVLETGDHEMIAEGVAVQ